MGMARMIQNSLTNRHSAAPACLKQSMRCGKIILFVIGLTK